MTPRVPGTATQGPPHIGGADPLGELTAYELRNLVTHLAEAGRVGALRGLLTLETADGRNAWHEAKQSAFGAYVLDVAAALRAVQELPPSSERDAPTIPRLGDEYLYALMLTSLNSLAEALPPSLMTALVQAGLMSTTDALSYARRATDAIQRAESLIRLLPALDESQRRGTSEEIVREIEASAPEVALAEQSKRAKLLASLVPHLAPAEATRIVERLIDELEQADRSAESAYGYVDALHAVMRHLTTDQARQLFELASRSRDELVRDDLLPVIAAAADGELLGRVLEAARNARLPVRASILAELAPRLPPGRRAHVLAEATEAALEWKSLDQLGKMLAVSPVPERQRVLQTLIEAAREEDRPGDRAAALLEAAAHLDAAHERDGLVGEALHAAEALPIDPPFPYRLVSLAQSAQRLPQPAKGRLQGLVLAAARETSDDSERVEALVGIAEHADDGDREALLAEAFAVFQEIDSISQAFALEELAPRLPPAMLREALRIVQVISDDDDRREALAALAPYLLRSRTDPEVASAVAAARAVHHTPSGRDILVALAGQLDEAQRASVLDTALTLAQEDPSTSVSRGLAVLAPSLDYTKAPEVRPVWERAVGIASEIADAPDRAHALVALAAVSVPGAPESRRVQADALLAARAIDDQRLAARAIALAQIGALLPEAEGAQVLEEASDTARLLTRRTPDRYTFWEVDAVAIVAADLGGKEGRALAREAVKLARRLPDHRSELKLYALATVAPCFGEPQRSNLLREALATARGQSLKDSLAALAPALDEPDRSAALSEALPDARKHGGTYDLWSSIAAALAAMAPEAASRVLRNPPGGLTTLPRDKLLTEIGYTAGAIVAIGGRAAVAEVADAVRQTAAWWP